MKYTFAARFNNITPSGIRAVLEKAAGPDMINFSPGFPDNDAFPANDIQKISQDVLRKIFILSCNIPEVPLIHH